MTKTTQAKIEEYVERVVAAAPPLTPAQRDRIAVLLWSPQADAEAKREQGRVRDRNEAARVLREALRD